MDNIIPTADIESSLPKRFGRGWYCFGLSKYISDKPQSFYYFGQQLVAYRSQTDDTIKILNAYCPHMGADLSKGEVQGDTIICPFHLWEWKGDGSCHSIPYSNLIPPKAKIKSWDVIEENGLFYVWYDYEGLAPIKEQAPPIMEEYYSNDWSDWHLSEIRIENNSRELIDNMADLAHFGPVHNAKPKTFKNIVEGHMFTQVMEGDPEGMENADSLKSRATYYGPSIMTTHMVSVSDGLERHSRLLVSHVPVTHNSFDLRFGLIIKKYPEFTHDMNDYIIQKYVDSTTAAFLEDVEIWHNKVRVDNPLLCAGDGPIHRLRQWYTQFYLDRSALGCILDINEYVSL